MPVCVPPSVFSGFRPLATWALLAAFAGLAGLAQAAALPDDLSQCEAPLTTVLRSVAPGLTSQDTPAGAAWLDDTHVRWPGVTIAPGQRLRLHHSESGRLTLVATTGRMSGADAVIALGAAPTPLPADLAAANAYLGEGAEGVLPKDLSAARRKALLQGQLLLTLEAPDGRVLQSTALQPARALDALYAAAEEVPQLGAQPLSGERAGFKLWAPTARQVSVCVYPGPQAVAMRMAPLRRDPHTGVWQATVPEVRSGQYYRYLVDVFVPGTGWVRNRVTDPYSISLSANSRRSYIADLSDPALAPAGWTQHAAPAPAAASTDMVLYELHVRDFSRDDASVPEPLRGKYLAFTQDQSLGIRHLRALAAGGLTDIHLLPIFDLASVPEQGCRAPAIPTAAPDSDAQQAAVQAVAGQDCFNWGYDPFHYNAPEGSFATDADDGAVRIREVRAMVMALHRAGLRVGMDVVYNHTVAAGQQAQSVLDRIVPMYYHRLDRQGRVERSTCCDNTATEHRMMGRLLIDSVVLWAQAYGMNSFRFDLMGHQPRAVMERLQARLRRELGHEVPLIGEGWNFGEVANGARFVQASQLSLNGTGIGTFSDRGRDAVRGGAAGDDAATSRARPGFIVPAPDGDEARRAEWLRQADLLRLALAGTLRSYRFETLDGETRSGEQMRYGDQPAGYASVPGETVNYVENHDNQTLFDALVLKLPQDTSPQDRARVQLLALGINALSQGVAYFHAGGELLRSKSMDRNSYDSGDWFNALDWRGEDNGFGRGLPPKSDNGGDYALLKPLLADARIKPSPAVIDWTGRAFLDLLRIRASTPLLRLRSAEEVQQRLRFYNTGPQQQPGLIVGRLDGSGRADARFERVIYLINANPQATTVTLPAEAGRAWRLHPVQAAASAADRVVAETASVDAPNGRFTVPARSVVVFVVEKAAAR
ncbi:pullulanase-type alpha-1,6-glucosidase [Roseateles depolymerans]|uniref:Alpha-1,6-glucosidase n=1 Tax=Roseateles depolymerans TaxID=76731 RepID=A0A0U3MI56_9BURK|nr:pullulanase-type alpha-1,6-glucosidase [Roseateles depolymerans]ALV08105.1 alpha-1,6-glucosidase [Roseateles depolymerans]REG21673.1 pullulanase-type alpha-1,6-glucosidase [Roseateles depolymerans]